MRLRTRVLASALGVLVLVCTLFLSYVLVRERNDARHTLDDRIALTRERMEQALPGPLYDGDVSQLNDYLDSVFRSRDLVRLELVEYRGNIRIVREREAQADGVTLEHKAVIRKGIDPLGEVRATYTTANLERRLASTRNELLGFAAILLAAVGGVILLVANSFTRPLEQLTHAVQAYAEGAPAPALDVKGARELVILGRSFARMREAIDAKIGELAERNRLLNNEIGQRQQTEQERDRLASILEATSDLVSMADPSGNILYFNRAARTHFGIDAGPEMGSVIPQVHPPWASELIMQQGIPTAIREGTWMGETALLGRDGEEIPVSQVIIAHKDAQGQLLYMSTIIRDIRDQKAAEEALRHSEAQLKEAQRLAHVGSWSFDFSTGQIEWSEEVYRMHELDPRTFVPSYEGFLATVHPGDRARVDATYQASIRDGTPYEVDYRSLLADGRIKNLHVRGETVHEQGRPLRTVGMVQDVTERRQAEEALRKSEERYMLAARIGQSGAWEMRPAEGKIYCDDNLPRLLGYGPGELTENLGDWVGTVPPEGAAAVQSALQSVIDGRSDRYQIEHPVRRKDGSIGWVRVSGQRVSAPGETPLRLVGSSADITERKQAELQLQALNASLETRVQERTAELQHALDVLRNAQDELVRSEKLASLGALVAGVAHELNTPLGNAKMVASTFSERRRDFEAAVQAGLRRSALDAFVRDSREIAEILERNLERAAELLSAFKQLAVDQSSYQRRVFEAGEVVREVALALSPTLRRSGVRLVDEVPAGLALDSYPGPLGQVLINLVNNAVIHGYADRAPGSVRVSAEEADAQHIRLTVRDDGRGIAAQDLKRVFDPFFTTRLGQGGSGLGLHIAYTLVTGVMGGRIEVDSEPGRGTEFRLVLPRKAPAAGTNGHDHA
jgi:PAS domain S-box-containing protein